MNLRQLEILVAVAKAGSFRQAAKKLRLSQPALSLHVKELEGELGVTLFDRLGRGVVLTEAGRLLEGYAVRCFALLDEARQSLEELRGVKRGRLVVGASTTPGVYLLPAVIGEFNQKFPQIAIALEIANTREIERRVLANELDLGVVGGHLAGAGETCVEASLLDELVLIVPPSHPLYGRREVAPSGLEGERLIVREEGSATRKVTEEAFRKVGITLAPAMELGNTEAIKRAVIGGLGVAIVSVHAVGHEVESGRLGMVRLRGVPIRRHFPILRRKTKRLGPAATAFVALLRNRFLSRS